MKIRKVNFGDEDFSLRSDQRKPESMLRELNSKCRSQLSKVEKRLEATSQLGISFSFFFFRSSSSFPGKTRYLSWLT